MLVAFLTFCLTAVLTAAAATALWVVFAPVAARAFAEMPWFPSRCSPIGPDDYGEGVFEAENVLFHTLDGTQLAGTYLPATVAARRGVVIFCHELRGNRATALAFTSGLRDQGFDILTFDFRNHGESATTCSDRPTPWATAREAADIQAAIEFCCRRDPAIAGQIALFGLSRGASAALCVAATDSRVQAAVLDSTVFTQQVQLFLIRRFMHFHTRFGAHFSMLPDAILNILVFWANRILGRQQGSRILPVASAAREIRKPVLFIHGGRDTLVPLETVCRLRKRMRCRPRLWVIARARHNETVYEVGECYSRRVGRFLLRHMANPLDTTVLVAEPVFASRARADEARCRTTSVAC